MDEIRSYMADALRAMADKIESSTHAISNVTLNPSGFSVTLLSDSVVTLNTADGSPLQPPFPQ